EAIGVVIGPALFRADLHLAHLRLGAQSGAGSHPPRQADETPEIKLLVEWAAIIVGGVAGRGAPTDHLAIAGKAYGRNGLPLTGETREDLAGVHIPEQNGFVIAA